MMKATMNNNNRFTRIFAAAWPGGFPHRSRALFLLLATLAAALPTGLRGQGTLTIDHISYGGGTVACVMRVTPAFSKMVLMEAFDTRVYLKMVPFLL